MNHGFSHSVAIIMAAHAYRSGKKLFWDPQNRIDSRRGWQTLHRGVTFLSHNEDRPSLSRCGTIYRGLT